MTCAGNFLQVFHRTLFCGIFSNCKNRFDKEATNIHSNKRLVENHWTCKIEQAEDSIQTLPTFLSSLSTAPPPTHQKSTSWWYSTFNFQLSLLLTINNHHQSSINKMPISVYFSPLIRSLSTDSLVFILLMAQNNATKNFKLLPSYISQKKKRI